MNNLGNALLRDRQFDAAIRQFRTVVAVRPDDPEAHNNLGGALGQSGKLDAAVGCLTRAMETNPNHDKSRTNIEGAKRLLKQRRP